MRPGTSACRGVKNVKLKGGILGNILYTAKLNVCFLGQTVYTSIKMNNIFTLIKIYFLVMKGKRCKK